MTGGNLLAYSALTTKIKAMHSKLLTNEQYEELAHFTTVADAFAYLQKLPYYEELFADIDPSTIHRGQIEWLLNFSTYSDFSKIYCNCKLLLLPSQEAEGLGRGSVEASLNSVPILASNNGGIPEAVKINDFLIFDYSNYASWRNALEKLFDPTIFAIHCQKALENAIAYERRYLNNSFSEYIDSILGQKKRYKSLNN